MKVRLEKPEEEPKTKKKTKEKMSTDKKIAIVAGIAAAALVIGKLLLSVAGSDSSNNEPNYEDDSLDD